MKILRNLKPVHEEDLNGSEPAPVMSTREAQDAFGLLGRELQAFKTHFERSQDHKRQYITVVNCLRDDLLEKLRGIEEDNEVDVYETPSKMQKRE